MLKKLEELLELYKKYEGHRVLSKNKKYFNFCTALENMQRDLELEDKEITDILEILLNAYNKINIENPASPYYWIDPKNKKDRIKIIEQAIKLYNV